jgi:hypothetical protein
MRVLNPAEILTLGADPRLFINLRVWGPFSDCVGRRKQNGGDRESDVAGTQRGESATRFSPAGAGAEREPRALLSFVNHTVLHHETHVGEQIDIRQGITTDSDDVGLLSRC